jgi:hypothetical protein
MGRTGAKLAARFTKSRHMSPLFSLSLRHLTEFRSVYFSKNQFWNFVAGNKTNETEAKACERLRRPLSSGAGESEVQMLFRRDYRQGV